MTVKKITIKVEYEEEGEIKIVRRSGESFEIAEQNLESLKRHIK